MSKLILFIVLAITIIGGFFLLRESADRSGQSEVLVAAPDFTLERLDGTTLTLSEYKGVKPVILDFWATWCPNCQRDMPRLNEYYKQYQDQLEVIGVNLQENRSLVERFIEDRGITFPIVLDPDKVATRNFNIRYTNYHVLISKSGEIVRTIPGDISEENILELLEEEITVTSTETASVEEITGASSPKAFAFKSNNLNTNTAKRSIELSKVLDGGPGKDGIPAINNPKFTNVKTAERDIADDVDGIVATVGGTTRFYPYNILVWHEIVNDVVGGKPLVVTFCPLCGSAIVFDTTDKFGVSGKLYESNLLMYDKSTESLWSQSIGTAVVGDRTGDKLKIYPSQVMPFTTFKNKWPNGEVLSADTGFSRNYSFYPYGNYDESEDLIFPVSVEDSRFHPKKLMYVTNAYGKSIAFPVKELGSSTLSASIGSNKVTASIIDGEIVAKDASGKTLPGYHEMWFSWAAHHQADGVVGK